MRFTSAFQISVDTLDWLFYENATAQDGGCRFDTHSAEKHILVK